MPTAAVDVVPFAFHLCYTCGAAFALATALCMYRRIAHQQRSQMELAARGKARKACLKDFNAIDRPLQHLKFDTCFARVCGHVPPMPVEVLASLRASSAAANRARDEPARVGLHR